jgi:PAS domain S-box-containing protein
MCEYNHGLSIAILKVKGYKNITLSEISCAAIQKETACQYKVRWTPSSGIIRKIKEILLFRFRNQREMIEHMEESHRNLQNQYSEILSIKDFYSHIMENIGEGIIWLDEEGKITFVNAGFCQIMGYSERELEGKFYWSFLSDKMTDLDYKGHFFKSQENKNVPLKEEFCYISREGQEIIGETAYSWITSEHQKPGFLVNVRDVTEKRKMERELYASENRYRTLYENSPAIIVGFSPDGKFLYANPAMVEQSGYSEQELMSMHVKDLVAPEAEDFDVNSLIKSRMDSAARLQEVHFKTKSGEWKAIALNSYPVIDDTGSLAGIACIGIDVTETKRLNEQLVQTQRMELLGQMAGGLAHDFNNILIAINGYSHLITKKTREKEIKEFADSIHKGS